MQQSKTVFNAKTLELVRQLQPPQGWEQKDADLTVWSTKETVDAGHSVLIFCGTKWVRALSVDFMAMIAGCCSWALMGCRTFCCLQACQETAAQIGSLISIADPERKRPEFLSRLAKVSKNAALLAVAKSGVAFHSAGRQRLHASRPSVAAGSLLAGVSDTALT